MMHSPPELRLPELMAALSPATELAMGQSMEYAISVKTVDRHIQNIYTKNIPTRTGATLFAMENRLLE